MDLLHKRDFAASPYRSERERLIHIERWNVRRYFKLLDKLEDFLESDRCYRLADNYLIAMVFTFLAYNLEEDESEYLLEEIEYWLECSVHELKQLHYQLFRRMDYRAAVSRACCEIVMRSANPEHKVWQRRRHVYHSGVVSKKVYWDCGNEDVCPICEGISEEEDVDH